mmetsp:Transcript_2199/g.7705  ORF Transcript_2199/g.7705 Transcript_2199/m.7705 type:complete len:250 (-) Transcript_2199:618-1367(-)
MKGCSSSCSADERRSGLVSRLLAKKWWKARLHLALSASLGASLMVMSSSARRGGSCSSGGSPSAISMAVMPRLHTSTAPSYSVPLMSSGAIQYGVPTTDVRLFSSLVNAMAKPKSATLTLPSKSTSTLSLLMSRCRWWCLCMYASAMSMLRHTYAMHSSGKGSPLPRASVKEPPCMSSSTMHTSVRVTKASIRPTTFSWLTMECSPISFCSSGRSEAGQILSALRSPVALLLAWYTTPEAPCPSFWRSL